MAKKQETAPAKAQSPTIYTRLLKAFKVSCPIVSLTTSDPAQAVRNIIATLPDDCLFIQWDCAQGCTTPLQERGDEAKKEAAKIGEVFNLTQALVSALSLSKSTVLIVHNAHRFLDREDVMQAIWNLRDAFKNPRRQLILLGPAIRLPIELQHDVIELDEPLPTAAELATVITSVAEAANIKLPSDRLVDASAASQGLSAFAAEQLAALNMTRDEGISVTGVWADKCTKINETPGLRVVSSGSFDDVAGVQNAKDFLSGILRGNDRPNAIVFVDEIEKALGGSGSDSSGVSQDQLGVLLQWMQDHRATGCIFVGPPGAAKSALAKAAGGEVEIPTIQLDLGGMKGSLVGESETRIRDGLKVIDSVSGGRTLWLATCNSMTALPPELRRRFKFGTFYFGLPTREERAAIWSLYCKKFDCPAPSDEMLDRVFTGAEIESCAEIAWRIGCSIEEASSYVVPIAVSSAEKIAELEAAADGRFISASEKGIYRKKQMERDTYARNSTREID